ncbi:MAG: hypothetical protein AAFQ66_07355 [Pseudomonadota bacterium]
MQIDDVLNKITDRNAPVIGCIAKSNSKVFHNLADYDIDCGEIVETVEELMTLTGYIDEADEDNHDFETVYAEFDGQCLMGQRVDDHILVAVTDHLQRSGFKKLQVGLSLQTRLLVKALEDSPAETVVSPDPEPQAEEPENAPAPARRFAGRQSSRSAGGSGLIPPLKRTSEEAAPEAEAAPAAEEPSQKGKTRRVYRGTVYWE